MYILLGNNFWSNIFSCSVLVSTNIFLVLNYICIGRFTKIGSLLPLAKTSSLFKTGPEK